MAACASSPRLLLKAVGPGDHRDIAVAGTGVVVGRGESTNVYSATMSRQHCYFSVGGGAATVRLRPLGRNSVVAMPRGSTARSYAVPQGKVSTLGVGDRIALLVTGEYMYEVTSEDDDDTAENDGPGSPLVDDTEDEADEDFTASAKKPAGKASQQPAAALEFRRVSSVSKATPQDIARTPEPTAQHAPPAPGESVPPPSLPASQDLPPAAAAASGGPPAKKQKQLPACKYGAACTRKNPTHFAEFSHPSALAGAAVALSAVDGAAKPACRYGAACTRKNPAHFKDEAHPAEHPLADAICQPPAGPSCAGNDDADGQEDEETGPPVDVDVEDPALRTKRAVKGVDPERYMPEDEIVYAIGCGEQYKMKYTAQGYYCTCVAWRYQNRSVDARTCKHLKEYLGAAFEATRCDLPLGGGGKVGGGGGGGGGGGVKKKAMAGVLLADKWDERDPTGWWISEKLDGVRAYWDGANFLSRNGNVFTAPSWFSQSIPAGVELDGELFGGRGAFQSTVGVVKSSEAHTGWKSLTYEVFDIPSEKLAWESRLQAMATKLAGCDKYIRVVDQYVCKNKAMVESELCRVLALGGEGLMLRQPGSMYVHKRSSTLLKVKKFSDLEAIVVAHEKGKGKNADRLGAFVCKLPNGKQFNVGTGLTDAQRLNPPAAVGQVITVKYQELTLSGVPRFPVFIGLRIDATWPPKS
ncbi:DNA ligase [Diplonema papillatum]|nr:DNA ligase [Diplonema papillatum]|eukprot:gene7291-11250_t